MDLVNHAYIIVIGKFLFTEGKYDIFNHYNCDKVDRILMGSWGLQEVWGEGELGELRNSKVTKVKVEVRVK